MRKKKALAGANSKNTSTPKPWLVTETENCDFPDERWNKVSCKIPAIRILWEQLAGKSVSWPRAD